MNLSAGLFRVTIAGDHGHGDDDDDCLVDDIVRYKQSAPWDCDVQHKEIVVQSSTDKLDSDGCVGKTTKTRLCPLSELVLQQHLLLVFSSQSCLQI